MNRFRFESNGIVPKTLYSPQLFDKLWELELNVRVIGFPRDEVSAIVDGYYRSFPRVFPALVPHDLSHFQRGLVPSEGNDVVFFKPPASVQSERARFVSKYTFL